MTNQTPREGGTTLDGRERAFIEALQEALQKIADAAVGVVTYDIVARLSKRQFISTAHRKLLESHEQVTQAQIALLTGIDPEAIRTALDSKRTTLRIPPFTVEQRIIQCWTRHPAYRDEYSGKPARLLIHGNGDTFQGLVRRISRAITPKVALESLTSHGVVQVVDTHWVDLVNAGWKPGLSEKQLKPLS